MLLLADRYGLKFFALEKDDPNSHIILLVDDNGKKAKIHLETAGVIENQLDRQTLNEALSDIQEFRKEFLQYWEEMQCLDR